MVLKTKRWCDPRDPDDGLRILVCRYRPRALPKADETWDEWWKDLGPSPELHRAFYGKDAPPISWEEYRARYLDEIEAKRHLLDDLSRRLRAGRRITLLCSRACTEPGRCHRFLLAELLLGR